MNYLRSLLPSLVDLSMEHCEALESFPEDGLPSSLSSLNIASCPKAPANSWRMFTIEVTITLWSVIATNTLKAAWSGIYKPSLLLQNLWFKTVEAGNLFQGNAAATSSNFSWSLLSSKSEIIRSSKPHFSLRIEGLELLWAQVHAKMHAFLRPFPDDVYMFGSNIALIIFKLEIHNITIN